MGQNFYESVLVANQFVDFYNETFEENYHFQLTTAGVEV